MSVRELFFATGLLALCGVFKCCHCLETPYFRFTCRDCTPKLATEAQRDDWEKADNKLRAKPFGKVKGRPTRTREGATGCKFVKPCDCTRISKKHPCTCATMARNYPDIPDEYSVKAPKTELPEDVRRWQKAKHYDSNEWLRTRLRTREQIDAFRAVYDSTGAPFLSILDKRIREDKDSRGFVLGHRVDVPCDVSDESIGAVPNAVRNTTEERLKKSYDWQWWKEHNPRLLARQPEKFREGIRWGIDGRYDYAVVARHVGVNPDRLRDRINYFRKRIPTLGENLPITQICTSA
jgi:hypothetical protein